MNGTDAEVRTVKLSSIQLPAHMSPREGLDPAHVRELMDVGPENWPPLVTTTGIVDPGSADEYATSEQPYLLIDGFHRYEAALRLGLTEIRIEVRFAMRRVVALGLAMKANLHGKVLSLSEKRARLLLMAEQDPTLSQGDLAKLCGVNQSSASRWLNEARADTPERQEKIEHQIRMYAARFR